MLKNDYLLAKIGFDTAENERCQVLNIFKFDPARDLNFAIAPRPAARASAGISTVYLFITGFRRTNRDHFSQKPRHITLSEARSRLDRRRSLQVNSHFSAFFKIYKIFTILRRSNLKIFAKFRQKSCILIPEFYYIVAGFQG